MLETMAQNALDPKNHAISSMCARDISSHMAAFHIIRQIPIKLSKVLGAGCGMAQKEEKDQYILVGMPILLTMHKVSLCLLAHTTAASFLLIHYERVKYSSY